MSSEKSLKDKLGIKAGFRAVFIGAPAEYFKALGPLPENIEVVVNGSKLDFIHAFNASRAHLAALLPRLKKRLKPAGIIWISWPKGGTGFSTDVNENTIRELALQLGLVDVKAAAVDDRWSGLKLVLPSGARGETRKAKAQRKLSRNKI
jgi:hypothetical protein